MDYSITYKLGLYTGKILAPYLTSQTIMALLSRTSLIYLVIRLSNGLLPGILRSYLPFGQASVTNKNLSNDHYESWMS